MNPDDKLVKFIVSSRLYRYTRRRTQKLILPGFDKMPLFDVIVFFFKGIWDGALTTRASSIAFKFFLAIFPALIFIFTLIPYIPLENFQQTLLQTITSAIPDNVYEIVSTTIRDIISRQNGGLLSLGFILALYFSLNGIVGVISAFNATAHHIETRTLIQQYRVSLLMVFIFLGIAILTTAAIILSAAFFRYMLQQEMFGPETAAVCNRVIRWIIIILALFLSVSFLYYLAPARKDRFRFISAGSTLATLLFVATTLGFNYYVVNFSSYNAVYGSIGTVIIVLMWFYVNALSLIIGFELNASIAQARRNINSNVPSENGDNQKLSDL